ncbi:MAG TPA: hypothetical protein VI195_09260 [Steroidobacteraceae bacterium]
MKGPTLALLALAAASAALAQTTPPPTTAEPPASAAPEEQSQSPTTPPPDSSSPNSADAQALMKDCMNQVQAANPNVPEKDIRNFCANEIAKSAQPRS